MSGENQATSVVIVKDLQTPVPTGYERFTILQKDQYARHAAKFGIFVLPDDTGPNLSQGRYLWGLTYDLHVENASRDINSFKHYGFVESGDSRPGKRTPQSRKKTAVFKAAKAIWPNGLPETIPAKVRDNSIQAWTVKHADCAVSQRTISSALKETEASGAMSLK